jgi:hypothetical protein
LIEFVDAPGLLNEYSHAAQKIGRPQAAAEVARLALGSLSHG